MTTADPQEAVVESGFWMWKARHGDVEVRFTGRGPTSDREEILHAVDPAAPPLAWAKQIHSAVVLPAQTGSCGEGDAVYTGDPDLALSVVTAIGPCCYEVGEDVAAQVVAASTSEVAHSGPTGKTHLDLQAAARHQLAAAGVQQVFVLPVCTRCEADKLWSYRREGKAAGRNMAFIWRHS